MKLIKMVAFGLLVVANPAIVEAEDVAKAPPSIALNYLEYCKDILVESDSDHEANILNCVNTELEVSGFETFATYSELIAYVGKGED